METVARKKDLPHIFVKENEANIPYYAIIIIAGLAALLASIGSLSALVDAASLIFLITFGVVNFIGFRQRIKFRFASLLGSISCAIAIVLSSYQQFQEKPIPLITIGIFIVAVFIGRPYLMKKIRKNA
jgi:hypothetical protein